MSRILYKYLNITGGIMMLGNQDLQYTNASQLNDPFDCHPNMVDFTNLPPEILRVSDERYHKFMIEKGKCDASNLRNNTWLTCFSKVNDSLLMWAHYCNNHSGICVGIDMEQVPPMRGQMYMKPFEIEVQYTDIINRPDRYRATDWQYQWRTKAKDWAYEQEVRLVIHKPSPQYAAFTPAQAEEAKKDKDKLWDWKEIHHYIKLPPVCFESVYFGINTSKENIEKLSKHMRKLNPETKLYQMRIDENAFRLKAELITE